MQTILRGRVHKYGADVNTDVIIPARYLNTIDPKVLAAHCMEDIDPDFVKRVRPGDIIVADRNFGCGSSREHAPIAIKASGISCIIAKTFARIFFRNSINLGLPVLECPEAVDGTQAGDELEVDLSTGTIRNLTRGTTFRAKPFPPFMLEVLAAGGLIEYTKRKLAGMASSQT
ncbi:MAG: 3-isopropylmalate dehydratase small subunit [Dehalococcoidia bacterium]|nr:3-isopropylmalate dehydratase small subunit [Dehalococcoidia bacterium]MDW8119844.1 3-isopropylmalate dehydratase small subunit [Chloroflexota bacterium]